MARSNRISDELLERVRQSIRALPVKTGKGQAEAAEFLSPAFKYAMKRGYTLDEIQGHVFKEFGLTLQMSKLKKALAAAGADQTESCAVNPKKEIRQKQIDTPPPPASNDGGPGDVGTGSENYAVEKSETQTSAGNEMAGTGNFGDGYQGLTIKKGKFVVFPDTPIGIL